MPSKNQKVITIGRKEPCDKKNLYTTTNLDTLQEAMKTLKGESFKLWCYLQKNQENFKLELSQKACEGWGIKKDAYYSGVNTLIKEGYLIETGEDLFTFSEKPKKTDANSEKPKDISEKPNNAVADFGKTEEKVKFVF